MTPVTQRVGCELPNLPKELNNYLKMRPEEEKVEAFSCEKCLVSTSQTEQLYLWALIG